MEQILLPLPRIRRDVKSIEETLALRRSIRSFIDKPIDINQLSQILWAAYGISDPYRGFKTAPSAGATFPTEIYVVVKENSVSIEDHYLEPGSYKYLVEKHAILLKKRGELVHRLTEACLGQEWVKTAAVNIVLSAVFERTTSYYGRRGIRYVYIEIGHIGQNIYLEATALGLGCVAIGAFYDEEVKQVVGLHDNEEPIYVMPIGVPSKQYSVAEEEIHRFINSRRKSIGE